MAALALMTVACSSNDENNFAQQPKTGEGITITAQLAPKSGSDATRALSDKTSYIEAKWAVDDEIAILYKVSDTKYAAKATVTDVNETTGAATIEFTVNGNTANNTPCTLIYPYSAANGEHDGLKDVGTLLGTQDGTLNANLDIRVGEGTIHTATPGLSVTTQPAAQYAIFKFTTKNADGSATINVKPLTITTGAQNFVITPSEASSTFYAALPPLTGEAISFIATSSTNGHTNIAAYPSITFKAGKYYQSTIKMTEYNIIDLSTVQWPITVQNGNVLTGELTHNVKISIADGATVTLNGVAINGTNNPNYKWAGITCLGDATIILKDGTENNVKGFFRHYPGIYVPSGKTLIIKGETSGTGSLAATSNGSGAGIGGGTFNLDPCGNIEIQGGTINATGGLRAAGIGSGYFSSCGNITITGGTITAMGGEDTLPSSDKESGAGIGCGSESTCENITITGGTITATGGANAAGIGSSNDGNSIDSESSCGAISITGGTIYATGGANGAGIGSGYKGHCTSVTIANTVTRVEAKKGANANNVGPGHDGTCGTVTIGGIDHWKDGNYVDPGKDQELLYGNNVLLYQP